MQLSKKHNIFSTDSIKLLKYTFDFKHLKKYEPCRIATSQIIDSKNRGYFNAQKVHACEKH